MKEVLTVEKGTKRLPLKERSQKTRAEIIAKPQARSSMVHLGHKTAHAIWC